MRIALIGENSIEFINILLNIWNDGDCAVLIDWRIPSFSATKMMFEAGVTQCYIDKTINYDIDINILSSHGIKHIFFNKESNNVEVIPKHIIDKYVSNYSSNEALILYSSGTTGKSKGIILSHYAISTNADAIFNYMEVEENDCIFIVKSLTHSSTIVGEVLVALKNKIKAVITSTQNTIFNNIKNISEYNATILCLNPTLLTLYLQEYTNKRITLPSLQAVYVSGSILNDNIYRLAIDVFGAFKIYNVYGLSEAGPRVSAQRKNNSCKKNTVGKPLKGVLIKIVPCNCDNRKEGIIYVKTPSAFSGYVVDNIGSQVFDNEWINTGDIGYFDNDNELVVVGRQDNCFMYESHKIYPEEIENVLSDFGEFSECIVCGNDNHIRCYYTSKTGKPIKNVVIRQMLKKAEKILPKYEMPKEFIFIESFKKNISGKIVRKDYQL